MVKNLGEIAQGGRRVYDLAAEVLGRFRKQVPEEQQQAVIRQALTQAAAMPQAEFDKKAAEIVELVLADEPPEQKKAATEYLKLIPARIRSTLSRPDDPSGTTLPANWALEPMSTRSRITGPCEDGCTQTKPTLAAATLSFMVWRSKPTARTPRLVDVDAALDPYGVHAVWFAADLSSVRVVEQRLQSRAERRREARGPGRVDEADADHVE